MSGGLCANSQKETKNCNFGDEFREIKRIKNIAKIIENTELFAIFRLHFQVEYGIIYTWI